MTTPTTRELYDQYVIPTYARFDLQMARGRGPKFGMKAASATSTSGRYRGDLDWPCASRVIAVMQQQIATLVHSSNLYYTRPQAVLAERLVRLTCAPRRPAGRSFSAIAARSQRGPLQARPEIRQRRVRARAET